MKSDFYSYLDGFNRITIIYPKEKLVNKNNKSFYTLVEHDKIVVESDPLEATASTLKFDVPLLVADENTEVTVSLAGFLFSRIICPFWGIIKNACRIATRF